MYEIEGARFSRLQHANNLHNYLSFDADLIKFKDLIMNLVKNHTPATFIHFGDGDYYFLKKMQIGSATPGKRALSIPYNLFDITPYKEGFLKNDYYCVEYLESGMIEKLNELYPALSTIPTEFLYGLTMNKWFLSTFKGHIGIIGAEEKVELIKELMKRDEYKKYLNIEEFNDYIKIPQKFACDNLENTINVVKEQLEKSNPNTFVYLFGVGHVKSGLIHHLPKIKNAVYIDVGAGIDGLAGLIDPDRPYASDWINYRLKHYSYEKIDLLNYNIFRDRNIKYID